MENRKKELKREYRETHTPMGIYQIRNIANDKLLIGSALNLPGVLNSQKFQLRAGSHPNRRLQSEWKDFGAESFVFEILDELTATEGPGKDYRADLAFLEEFWREKLQPYGERGYNEPRKGSEEMLRAIAQKRLSKDER